MMNFLTRRISSKESSQPFPESSNSGLKSDVQIVEPEDEMKSNESSVPSIPFKRQSHHDLGVYICLPTIGVSYREECSFSSPCIGLVPSFGRVNPLRMFDEYGEVTDHVGKFAWMEIKIADGLYFLPLHSVDGDLLFRHHSASFHHAPEEPTIKESQDEEDDQQPINKTVLRPLEESHPEGIEEHEKNAITELSDDDFSGSSTDSYSSESEDEEHPDEPSGEDLGLTGALLYGHRFLSKIGLGKYHAKFMEVKLGELSQLCDEGQVSDEILTAAVGFSSIQIQVFRLEVMKHQNSDHRHHHHGRHHKKKQGGDGGEEEGRGEEGGDEHHDDGSDHDGEDSSDESGEEGETKKEGLLAFAAQAFKDNAEEAKKPKLFGGLKGKWGVLRGRLNEARDAMLANSEAERKQTQRATKAADDLSKLFSSIDFSLPPAPSPPTPSPPRLRALSAVDIGRPDTRGAALDFKARAKALEIAEKKCAVRFKPPTKTRLFKGVCVDVPPGEQPGFVWTDGGVVIYVHKGKVVEKAGKGKVRTGWRLCEVNGKPIIDTAKYDLVKRQLNEVKDSKREYALAFEPPDPAKQKNQPLGSPL